MKLYDYLRSSAAYRVRIALNLKGLQSEIRPVNLAKGEQAREEFRRINPQRLVPVLETEQGVLSQSLAIIEYLDEIHPQPALLPSDPWRRAQVRSAAYTICCDIHPLNNLRVLNYLSGELQSGDEQKQTWYAHWIQCGFEALEAQLGDDTYCCGDNPTLADVCIVPQMYNARRFNVALDAFPKLSAIDKRLNEIPAFAQASPDRQDGG